jgi:hypothetical protein
MNCRCACWRHERSRVEGVDLRLQQLLVLLSVPLE